MNIQADDNPFPGADEYYIISGQEIMNEDSDIDGAETLLNEMTNEIINSINLPQYEEEWLKTFAVSEINIEELKSKAVNGLLRASRFRSLCWRCMLGVLHSEPKQWKDQLQTYRKHYDDLKSALAVTPWSLGDRLQDDNPLSQDSESIWCKYFCDQELKSVIEQDVVRTFPGIEFFHKHTIQESMVSILFCYARQNPTLCYRQGMHEILAPILFVLHCDHQALLLAKEQNLQLDNDLLYYLDCNFLEQDSYSIFKHIMIHIESSYTITNVMTTSTGYFPSASNTQKNDNENEVVARLEHIREYLLHPTDTELYSHLQELDIPLQLFGIRWLRLLFGREFPLQDLLVLWDTIFAGDNFDLVNYIVVAMLLAIRDQLLVCDYTGCLTNLMKYPASMDIMFIIQHALHLKDPQSFSKPSIVNNAKPNVRQDVNRGPGVVIDVDNKRLKSVKTNSSGSLKIKSNQFAPAITVRNGEVDSNIVDGYTLNDPALLQAELEHVQAVMGLVRLKLSQYHTTLVNNLPNKVNIEVQQSLDGISELCSLLKSHQTVTNNVEIEPAKEAGELTKPGNRVQNKKLKPKTTIRVHTHLPGKGKSNTLPKVKPRELDVFKIQCDVDYIVGAPMTDPIKLIKTNSDDNICERFPNVKDINSPGTSRQK